MQISLRPCLNMLEIASEKLMKVYLPWPIQYKHAPLQDSVRGYIREIPLAMLLQIQTENSRVITRSN